MKTTRVHLVPFSEEAYHLFGTTSPSRILAGVYKRFASSKPVVESIGDPKQWNPVQNNIQYSDTFPESFFITLKMYGMKKKMSMEIVNPNAAGIDIGSRFHMGAIGRNAEEVKRFGVYTEDYEAMIQWLKQHHVTTVAMESTGNYWQVLFSSLQKTGFEVILVNGSHTKNVKGKKTDVQDCMWIQKLHSLGLLSGSFLPGEYVEQLRTYFNHRQHIIDQCTKYINKMQTVLRLMNIRLDVVLNDITGQSGRAIIEAILCGERNPETLALLAHTRVKKSKEEIAKSLHGTWREDLLFEKEINPVVRGWINYYGKFYKTKMIKFMHNLNIKLASWARRKYKKLRTSEMKAIRWLHQISVRRPKMFAHWELLGSKPTVGKSERHKGKLLRAVLTESQVVIPGFTY